MAIGAANLFASNILTTFETRRERPRSEAVTARYLSVAVLLGALVIATTIKPAFAIDFQLLGGAWILQIFPAVALGLYTRWFHPHALLLGWLSGMCAATLMAVSTNFAPIFSLHVGGASLNGAIIFYSLLVNLAVTYISTWTFGALKIDRGADYTVSGDYA